MKAVLVVDMPENCEECQFYDGDCCYATGVKKWGGLSFRSVDNWKIREEWCPLKSMPKKKGVYQETGLMTDVINLTNVGWNACLDEIQNESTDSD